MELMFLLVSSIVFVWIRIGYGNRHDDLVKIQRRLSMVNIGDVDQPTWKFSKNGVYNCAATWEVTRHKQQQVRWWRLIWFLLAIPRQAFILQLCFL
jgi:hypothetical protein